MMPIAIKQATLRRLHGLRLGRESYDSLLNRLADCHEEAFARPAQTTPANTQRESGKDSTGYVRRPRLNPFGRLALVGVEGRAHHSHKPASMGGDKAKAAARLTTSSPVSVDVGRRPTDHKGVARECPSN